MPILSQGLKDLEYRGYDSGGIFINHHGRLYVRKAVGEVDKLIAKLAIGTQGASGMAHNRWATHGRPSELNAHPHSDCSGQIWVVHNGIVENHAELRKFLLANGHKFKSETDTEVLPHLIEHYLDRQNGRVLPALKCALAAIKGAYGLVLMHQDHPDRMWLARMGSPLVLGIGKKEMLAASDIQPIRAHTNEVIFLEDGDIFEVSQDQYTVFRNGTKCQVQSEIIDEIHSREKSHKYPHDMLREIMEQDQSIEDSLRGRLLPSTGQVKLGGLELVADRMKKINKITIVACGTAYYAGLVGKYWLEEYGGIEAEVELASEFRYRAKPWRQDSAVLAISQSGETADTLEALKAAKAKGILTLGIVNAVKSSIARISDAGVYNHIGPEVAVASTKAFSSQLAILMMMSIWLGQERGLELKTRKEIVKALAALPAAVKEALQIEGQVRDIARRYSRQQSFVFLGRTYNFPIALEGALKLKELAYVFAEGYASGEMKHGPIALADKNLLSFFLLPKDLVYEKNISNLREIEARGCRIITITDSPDPELESLSEEQIILPATHHSLSPILNVIPMQLFAYFQATLRGKNVDKPRNLAKSVTVE